MKKLFAVLMSIMMIACFMPTMAFADDNPAGTEATSIGISKATLHDTRLEANDEETQAKGIANADLFDTYDVSDDGSTITITVKNLAEHQNGDSPANLGKWVGFVLPKKVVDANTDKQLWYKYNTDGSYNPLTKDQIATELGLTNNEGIAFYFNLAGNKKTSFSYYFGDKTEASANAKTLSIRINETYDHPNEVIVAPLVDKANPPETDLFDKYAINYNQSTGKATITVKNLKEHTNGKKAVGKWVGIAVPVEANVKDGVNSDGIIYKLNDGKENNVPFIHDVGETKNYDERWSKTPEDGQQYISFYFNAEAPEGLTLRYAFRDSKSNKRTEFKTVDANVIFEQDASNVTFAATDADKGTLSGLVANEKYTVNGKEFTAEGENHEVTGITAGELTIVKKANKENETDSEAKIFKVEQATQPTVISAACTTAANNDGKLTGVTTAMQYKLAADTKWTDISADAISTEDSSITLPAGTYHVRVKASGMTLASTNQEVTIAPYTEPTVATAAIDAVTISGKRGTAIKDTDIKITLTNEAFNEIAAGTKVTDWINLPAGLTAKIKDAVAENATTATITINGTATVACNNVKLQVKIPATSLKGGKELTVSENEKAVFTITNPSSGGGSYYPYTPSTPSKPAAPNLDKTKTDSAAAINAAATANKYDAAEQAEVKKILDKANADIKNAKTEAEVKAIEEAAQAEIDKILTTEEKAIVAALDNVEKRDFATKSKVITRKGGKKVIRLTWTAPDGVDVDGYEIFRSTKKNSGFGTKPYFETTNTSYTNTKNLKSGKTYYYKVRAFVVINGERVYTDYSMKAFRTIK